MNFFNDSFKSLKSALEEKINFEDPEDETRKQDDTENENLKKLVQHQSDEIELLRKQIFDYQQSKLNDTRTLLDANRRRTSSINQQQNDSWFWEQETSSAASKDDSPAEMADLTTIPLDANDHEVIEKLRQQIADKESKVKSLNADNAVLNEKLKHLSDENQQLNKSIEELDRQHQVAIEKVLDVKNSIQEKFTIASDENEKFKMQIQSYRSALDAKDAEKLALKESSEQMTEIARKCELQMEALSTLNLQLETEIAELKNAPEQVAVVSSDECLKKINALINSNFKLSEEYVGEEQFMKQLAKWMSTTSTKLREMDFEISKLIDENKHIKEEASKHTLERDALKAELINYEIECTELLKSNTILMADIENLRTSGVGKLETILENDDDEEVDSVVVAVKTPVDDDFTSIQSKLEATEVERSEYFDQIQSLKNQLSENVARCKSYQQEIENLENEKCNYLFELNELKSEEERNILQKELKNYKDREIELLGRLDEVERERDELQNTSNAISTSQNKTLEEKEVELAKALNEMERLNVMREQLNQLEGVRSEMSQRLRENEENIQQLTAERDSLLLKCEELKKTNDGNLENLQKSNEQVQELQKKLLEASGDDELKNIENKMAAMSEEKNEIQNRYESTLRDLQTSSEINQELYGKLQELKEDLNSKNSSLEALNSEKESNISQIDELNLKISTLEHSIQSLLAEKQQLTETKNSTAAELQSSKDQIEELQQKLHSSSPSDDFTLKISALEQSLELLKEEKEELFKSYTTNLENLEKSNQQLKELQQQLQDTSGIDDETKAKISTLEESLLSLNNEKEGLIALVTTKHNENVQYHNEILRLNQLLQQDEARKAENEEQFNDQIKFLREKCDLLAQNLLQEQNNYRLLQQEKNDVVESNNTLNKDIERLRQHLLEVADAYTFEQVSLQKQVEEYKDKLMAVESDAKQSATAYTSASIRANQQAETIQAQYNLLVQQRDELLMKLSQAEDRDNKNQAALTNLQIALEIFQRDKENDIDLKTTSLQKELVNERNRQMKLGADINQLQAQLQEAKNGLMAAARLSDQLELSQLTIDKLNNEIASYQSTIQSLKKQLEDSNANTSNADIALIKNLILGYITAPNAVAKTQILKLIANVLNLNDIECTKVGLKSGGSGSGWFSRGGSDSVNNNVSLTEAFVAFLEKESTPRPNANLLTIHENDAPTVTRKISTGSSSSSPDSPAPIMLSDNNTLLAPYNNRNSSSILKDILHDT